MAFDVAEFRLAFPEFADESVYPDSAITFWAELAEGLCAERIFKSLYKKALFLCVAHFITLAAQNVAGASGGGSAGSAGRVVASKAVGAVSISYDNANGTETNAGQWNATSYGRQYYALARLFGAGCVQL